MPMVGKRAKGACTERFNTGPKSIVKADSIGLRLCRRRSIQPDVVKEQRPRAAGGVCVILSPKAYGDLVNGGQVQPLIGK